MGDAIIARDSKGRFVKGASGNPQGRLPKQTETSYLQVSESVCTFDVWREIVAKAVEQAKRGDARARQWLSDYLMGKPISMVMAVQDNRDTSIKIEYVNDWRRKLDRLASENSNNPITIDWGD
ncbi:MAG TPA: DUF5681 domain-containing protein [Paludibacteraceae bacterium]|nr:DUF5681 domain-containing protein [Paludibacteraceae bacterium]